MNRDDELISIAGAGSATRSWWRSARLYQAAALLACVFIVRAPGMIPSVIDWDESLYILGARALLDGGLPYVTVFDDKPLGAPVLIASAMKLFGSSVLTVRLLGSLAVAVTALLLLQLSRLLRLPESAGMAAALFLIAFSTQLFGVPTNEELLLLPFTVAALCVAAAGWDASRWRRQVGTILGMGILFGIAIWIKYVAAVPAAALFATLVGAWTWKSRALVKAAALAGLYAVACTVPTAATAAIYAAAGHFATFWYCNFGFMGTYMTMMSPAAMARNLVHGLYRIWPLLVLGALGTYMGWRRRSASVPSSAIMILTVWLAAEAFAVVAPWKFYDHYFLLLLPSLSLLSGVALCALANLTTVPRFREAVVGVLAGGIALLPLTLFVHDLSWLLARPDVPRQIAAMIRENPGVTAWVVNYEPIVYFLANIPAPTRFPFPQHLVGKEAALIRTDPVTEVERILASRPGFLVVQESGRRWDTLQPGIASPIRAALTQDYARVATFQSPWKDNVGVYRLNSAGLRQCCPHPP